MEQTAELRRSNDEMKRRCVCCATTAAVRDSGLTCSVSASRLAALEAELVAANRSAHKHKSKAHELQTALTTLRQSLGDWKRHFGKSSLPGMPGSPSS